MKTEKITNFLSKLDIENLLVFDSIYQERKAAILRDYWSLENIRCEFASYIECHMDEYLEDKITDCERELYYPNGFAEDFIVDDETFIQLTNSRSFEELQGYVAFLEVIPGARKGINEIIDFDWNKYCEYYHTVTLRECQLTTVLEQ